MPKAVLCLAACAFCLAPLAPAQDEPARDWVKRLIEEEYPKEAIDALVGMGEKAVPALLDMAAAEWWHHHARARYVLLRIGERSVPQLTAALQSDDQGRRRFAIDVLCELGRADLCRPLLRGQHAFDTAVALCGQGVFLEEALPALLEVVHGADKRRRNVVHYLGRFRAAVPTLRKLLNDADPAVRRGATISLGMLADESADAREALMGEYRSTDPERRIAAMWAFSGSADLDLGICLDALDQGGEELSKAARHTIFQRWIKKGEPLGELRARALGHSDPRVRSWACGAVARADRQARPDLLAMTADGTVALAALDAIETIGTRNDAVKSALARAHASESRRVQVEAAHVMVRMDLGRGDAIIWFQSLLPKSKRTDPYPQLNNFTRIGPAAKDAVPHLLPFLEDARAIEAARAIWSITGDLAPILPTLKRDLSDKWLRREAIVLAGEIGPPAKALVPWIVDALKDDEVWVRRDAVDALGRIRHPATADALRERLRDERPVRRAAAAALYRLGALTEEATRALEGLAFEMELMGSWDEEEWGPAEAAALRFRWEAGRPLPDTVGSSAWWLTYGRRSAYEFVELLGDMGAAAREAEPALRQLCRTYHPYFLRRAARAALARIKG